MNESAILPHTLAAFEKSGDLTSFTKEPSASTLARDTVLEMLEDEDVLALSPATRGLLQRYAVEIATNVQWTPSMRIAVFGDIDNGVGEITITDRSNRREMQVTVRDDSTGTFWLRGDRDRLLLENLPIDAVPLIVTRFQML